MGLIFDKGMRPDTEKIEIIKTLKNPDCKKRITANFRCCQFFATIHT